MLLPYASRAVDMIGSRLWLLSCLEAAEPTRLECRRLHARGAGMDATGWRGGMRWGAAFRPDVIGWLDIGRRLAARRSKAAPWRGL
jgi:hypothetical protein